jgi:hypothetical protein
MQGNNTTNNLLQYNNVHSPQINTGTENNRCIKWGMVVKGRIKKPEKDDL